MDNITNDEFGFQFDVDVTCGLVNTSIDLINMIKQSVLFLQISYFSNISHFTDHFFHLEVVQNINIFDLNFTPV